MTLFIMILDKLQKRLDNCTGLPRSSLQRISAEIRKLDTEERKRIKKV
jgi:hypothetical protein